MGRQEPRFQRSDCRSLHAGFRTTRMSCTDVKNVRDAQALLTVGQRKEKGIDAIGADYKRIRKELVRPMKLANRNLESSPTRGSPETLDQILAEMLSEAEGIVADLKEIME